MPFAVPFIVIKCSFEKTTYSQGDVATAALERVRIAKGFSPDRLTAEGGRDIFWGKHLPILIPIIAAAFLY